VVGYLVCLPIAGSLDLIWTYSHILGGGMTDSEYHRTLALGAVIGACFTILGIYMLKPDLNAPPLNSTPKSNFEVVDKYKNCEVVRWTNGQLANYQFFLDCK
jgi:hypothetical protein